MNEDEDLLDRLDRQRQAYRKLYAGASSLLDTLGHIKVPTYGTCDFVLMLQHNVFTMNMPRIRIGSPKNMPN